MRLLMQSIASERARKSVIPVAFWFISIGGGVLYRPRQDHSRGFEFPSVRLISRGVLP
jgi:hypothetical protein